jgi:hypothetical protein
MVAKYEARRQVGAEFAQRFVERELSAIKERHKRKLSQWVEVAREDFGPRNPALAMWARFGETTGNAEVIVQQLAEGEYYFKVTGTPSGHYLRVAGSGAQLPAGGPFVSLWNAQAIATGHARGVGWDV